MTDLTFDNSNNVAGIYLIRYVPVIGVATLPAPNSSLVVSAEPTFQPGYRWFSIYGTDATKSYNEEQSTSDNGNLWSVTTSLFLPSDSTANRSVLADLVRYRFIIEVQDNVGLWRRVGTLTENLSLTYKFGIGPSLADRRGYSLSFAGTLTAAPPLVTS